MYLQSNSCVNCSSCRICVNRNSMSSEKTNIALIHNKPLYRFGLIYVTPSSVPQVLQEEDEVARIPQPPWVVVSFSSMPLRIAVEAVLGGPGHRNCAGRMAGGLSQGFVPVTSLQTKLAATFRSRPRGSDGWESPRDELIWRGGGGRREGGSHVKAGRAMCVGRLWWCDDGYC